MSDELRRRHLARADHARLIELVGQDLYLNEPVVHYGLDMILHGATPEVALSRVARALVGQVNALMDQVRALRTLTSLVVQAEPSQDHAADLQNRSEPTRPTSSPRNRSDEPTRP